ncbi:hypothetical protein AL035_19260 [Salipiger aestuarii]|uniref:Two-component system KDP operon response regulator KdpE n=1 Tax=Salipiger aestuarii TaxID=568098 RepID=A0A327XLQ9_9RHOB|nr:response regulator [Salipiger aestuarii]KAB2538448.1 hypothetical protein AL035_19260 [Salipiger aestuarii]RAK09444.1 two-component system KDP operon response regulator KdpE [Salipiger aestuarii]
MARLLLADDDRLFCNAFRSGMIALGHQVETTSTGDMALKRLQEIGGAIDLVFLDMLMGGGGGAITLHRIRQIWPDLPVVVITGQLELADSPLFTEGLQLASERLAKPARLRELDEVIHRLLCG